MWLLPLQALATQLNEAYRRAGESLAAEDPDVRVEKKNGRDRLCLTPLDKLDEPASLLELRRLSAIKSATYKRCVNPAHVSRHRAY
jgi:hypothetical protein